MGVGGRVLYGPQKVSASNINKQDVSFWGERSGTEGHIKSARNIKSPSVQIKQTRAHIVGHFRFRNSIKASKM